MKLRDLAQMAPAKKREAVADLVQASMGPPNGQMGAIEAQLRAFEHDYGMTTGEMMAKFRAGELEDTPEIARWLIFAKRRVG